MLLLKRRPWGVPFIFLRAFSYIAYVHLFRIETDIRKDSGTVCVGVGIYVTLFLHSVLAVHEPAVFLKPEDYRTLSMLIRQGFSG